MFSSLNLICVIAFFSMMFPIAHSTPLFYVFPSDSGTTSLQTQMNEMKGVDWSYMNECTKEQKEDLVQAFRDVQRLTMSDHKFPAKTHQSVIDFIGTGYDAETKKERYLTEFFENIWRAGQFIKSGDGQFSGKSLVTKPVIPRCKDVSTSRRCETTKGIAAMAGDSRGLGFAPQMGETRPMPDGTAVVFCPVFFTKKHISTQITGRKTKLLTDLVSQEYIVLHELMHAEDSIYYGPPGGTTEPNRIVDRTYDGTSLGESVYGVRMCKKYANKKHPNILVRVNADNYAWFAVSYFFSELWKIKFDSQMDDSGPPEVTYGRTHDELRVVEE